MTGMYPGSFDPVTYGHLDIIKRASKIYDKLYVAVMVNEAKSCLFTIEERMELLRQVTKDLDNVEIVSGTGLTVDLAHKLKVNSLIRGLRASMDFEYELQQATINMTLAPDIESIFYMAKPEYSFLSSSSSKVVAENGGNLEQFVPEVVARALKEKFEL